MLRKSKLGKSYLMILAVVLTISVVLAGCGSKNNDSKDSGSSPSKAATESKGSESSSAATEVNAADLPEVTLSITFPGTAPKDEKKVEEALNAYLKDKINAKIDINMIDWGQWDNKINLAIAGREEMDILFTASWNGHSNNVAKGAFLALNDPAGKYGNLLETYGQGILETLPPAFLAGAKINGFNYAIPTNKELAEQGGVIYRTDIAEELGLTAQLDAVKTIADLEPILAAVHAKKPELTTLYLKDGENFNSHYFAKYDHLGDNNIEGVVLKNGTDTTVKARIDFPVYKETLNITRDFFQKGFINKDAATAQLSPQDAMKAGNVFMGVFPLKPGKDAEVATAANLQGKLKQINMTDRTVSTGETAGSMLGITTTSKNPERAMMFINLLHTDKTLNNLLNFGIEGDHYTRNGEIITATDNTPNYAIGASWMFGSQFLNYIWSNEDPNKWELFKAFNTDAKNSPALGFTLNSEPISSQASVQLNIRKEFDPGLDTGSIDPAKADEYFKKLNDNGLGEVIAEKQNQLNAFLAAK
ncbi:MAG: ABC transporter substrate-binding protein [Candidatus Cohnella colombiensis]|uniref:ABC transporter substrate-binding protein n=1 Tax=Candidatus Cohnella colombiensis TaxID=3121368 RepID=A0AA95EYC8_9BACL|nr:MAG: ABC transporter substrate-binding protein [Cohnella sp.]